jgi:ABC-type sugar transport system ATPase subunit
MSDRGVGVHLEAVEARFGSFSLAVTLEAKSGEYLVILGPSGCGKSLLLGTVAGIHYPEQGRVVLGQSEMTGAPPEQRNLGFVFQKASLFPHLSVAGNIEFGLRARGEGREARKKRVAELAETLALESLMGRPVSALSGGEAQKVAIARALAPRPSLLLLDEPLSLVDHNARQDLQEELGRVHAQTGITVLHVTHNREEARALGQRCAVMLGGRIVQTGETEEVFTRPRCLFVARFLGLSETPDPPEGCAESCLAGTGRCDAPYLGES